ncbi:hypothetical protein ACWC0C_44095 [Streptomyces sp. NPDC001709]
MGKREGAVVLVYTADGDRGTAYFGSGGHPSPAVDWQSLHRAARWAGIWAMAAHPRGPAGKLSLAT